jgi:hypothetical protein
LPPGRRLTSTSYDTLASVPRRTSPIQLSLNPHSHVRTNHLFLVLPICSLLHSLHPRLNNPLVPRRIPYSHSPHQHPLHNPRTSSFTRGEHLEPSRKQYPNIHIMLRIDTTPQNTVDRLDRPGANIPRRGNQYIRPDLVPIEIVRLRSVGNRRWADARYPDSLSHIFQKPIIFRI